MDYILRLEYELEFIYYNMVLYRYESILILKLLELYPEQFKIVEVELGRVISNLKS